MFFCVYCGSDMRQCGRVWECPHCGASCERDGLHWDWAPGDLDFKAQQACRKQRGPEDEYGQNVLEEPDTEAA